MQGRRMALGGSLGVVLALGTAGVARADCPGADEPVTAASAPAATTALLCLLDEARARAGVSVLTRSPALMTTAQQHADAIASGAEEFDHDTRDGRTTDQRAKANGFDGFAGENLAGSQTPRSAMELLLGDAPHRDSLLGAHTHVGAGTAPGGMATPYGIFAIVVGNAASTTGGGTAPKDDTGAPSRGTYFSIGQLLRSRGRISVSGVVTTRAGTRVRITLKRGRHVRRATAYTDAYKIYTAVLRPPAGRGPITVTASVRVGTRVLTRTRTLR